MSISICVFGDSIVWGGGDDEMGGWVNRLRLSIEEKMLEVEVYNLGIPSDTSQDLLNRFEVEALARGNGAGDVALIAVGVNDSATDDEGHFLIAPAKFEDNLKAIAGLAKSAGYAAIFLGLHDVDETKTNPMPGSNLYYSQEDLDQYSDIVKAVAAETESYFLDIKGLLSTKDLADGLHPNEIGHAKIAEAVEKYLINNKIVNI